MNPATNTSCYFGFWTGLFVVISCMVGAGILTTSGFTLKETGNPWSLFGLWLLGGMMAICGAMTIAELSTRMPRVGGDYVFVKTAFGRGAGFVVGWATFVIGFAGPTAVIALLSSKYILTAMVGFGVLTRQESALDFAAAILATIMIVIITSILCRGYKESASFQSCMTVLKLAIFGAILIAGFSLGTGDWSHFSQGGWPKRQEWPALATGLIYVGYAYSGWNAAAYLAGEIKSPEKLLARCMISGTLFVMVLYLLLNILYVYAISPEEITKLDYDVVEKIAQLALVKLFGVNSGYFIGFVLGLSLISSVSAYLLTGPRVALVMSQDGMFPPWAGGGVGQSSIPVRGTMFQGILAIAMIWSGSFLDLLNYMSAGLALISGLVVVCIFPLRRKSTELQIYRIPLYPLPPLFYLMLIIWTLSYALIQDNSRWPTLLSILTIGLGIPIGKLTPFRSHSQDR